VVIEIETIEGARLLVRDAITLDAGALVFNLRSVPGQGIRLPLHRVRAIRPSGGAFVYASDLPFEGEYVPYYRDNDYMARWNSVRADRHAATRCPLRLDGRTYRHGFSAYARSRVTLETAGRFRRLEALFGVDDAALEGAEEVAHVGGVVGGIVDARVIGDGEVLWEAKSVRVGEPPRTVGPLDIAKVKRLVLEVDFGAGQQYLDRAAWVDPLLVR
jgi:hypothetical protein